MLLHLQDLGVRFLVPLAEEHENLQPPAQLPQTLALVLAHTRLTGPGQEVWHNTTQQERKQDGLNQGKVSFYTFKL